MCAFCALTGCRQQEVKEESSIQVEEVAFGQQVAHAGYRSVQMDTYDSDETNRKKLSKETPESRTIISYDYEGKRTAKEEWVNYGDELKLSMKEKYIYDGDTVSQVQSLDEEGQILTLSYRQEDGSWKDYDKDNQELDTSIERDTYGNVTLKQEENERIQTGYDANGYETDIRVEDPEGNTIKETIYTRNTNGHLSDMITVYQNDSKTVYTLMRGSLRKDRVTNIYYDAEKKEVEKHIDTYDESGLLQMCQIDNEGNEQKTRILYTYKD